MQLTPELTTIIAAAIGLTPVVLKWLNDRRESASRHRQTQHAKEQVEFWQVWLQAQREVATDERFAQLKEYVAKRLDELKAVPAPLRESDADGASEVDRGPTTLQKVFLAYWPNTFVGLVFHTFFYITVAFGALFLIGSAIDEKGNTSWEYFKDDLTFVIGSLAFMALIAMILALVANRSERRYWARRTQSGELDEPPG